jgi:hypothetical protein
MNPEYFFWVSLIREITFQYPVLKGNFLCGVKRWLLFCTIAAPYIQAEE